MRSGLGLLAIMLLAAAVGVIAAHSQSTSVAAPSVQSTPTPLPPVQPRTVYIRATSSGAQYVPATLHVNVGQRVTWINSDTSDHSATADDGAFNTNVLNPGQKYVWKATKRGTHTYSDYVGANTQGTIVVR